MKFLMWIDEEDEKEKLEYNGFFGMSTKVTTDNKGTWGRVIPIDPTNPFMEDVDLDYSESDDWEALAVGVEDLEAGSDGESDSEDPDPNEYNFVENNFLVPDEYFSEDEGITESSGEVDSNDDSTHLLLNFLTLFRRGRRPVVNATKTRKITQEDE